MNEDDRFKCATAALIAAGVEKRPSEAVAQSLIDAITMLVITYNDPDVAMTSVINELTRLVDMGSLPDLKIANDAAVKKAGR